MPNGMVVLPFGIKWEQHRRVLGPAMMGRFLKKTAEKIEGEYKGPHLVVGVVQGQLGSGQGVRDYIGYGRTL